MNEMKIMILNNYLITESMPRKKIKIKREKYNEKHKNRLYNYAL